MDNRKAIFIFPISFFVLLLDQVIKRIIIQYLTLGESIPIISNYVSLTLIYNTGAGFGILKGNNKLLIFATIIILGIIFYYYDKLPENRYVYSAVGLIIGGTLGNLLDRLKYGHVVDFIDLGFWPAFNLADSAITIGVAILFIYLLKTKD